MTCDHLFNRYLGSEDQRGVECIVAGCAKCTEVKLIPLYARDRGECRICGKLLYGRDVCDNRHCKVEATRKTPCKFERLRNT